MSSKYSNDIEVTRSYYNSQDAHNFYYQIWGGEDLHLGIYESENDTVYEASRRAIDRIASHADKIDENTKVIDFGGGFSGSARHLARKFGCHVTVLNLSETENERGRKMNKEQGLDHLIDVIDGSYDQVPFDDNTFDVVWSEDAMLHSPNKAEVIKEAFRILKPGGDLVFSDPMQTDNCDESVLQPIYKRINLSSMASPAYYRQIAKDAGFKEIEFEEMPQHLITHYARIHDETERQEEELKKTVSQEYIKNMKAGLMHWVNGGRQKNLTWGIFHFKKP
ncbi:MAG: methyltransferase domain-containing protein [Marinilabiliaceae bacterium]